MRIFIVIAGIVVFLAACTAKKKATTVDTTPTEAQLAVAKTKYPQASMELLNKGHNIYYGSCTNCHGPKDIARRSEEEWPKIIDRMAPRAKLTAEEKDAVF